MASKKTKKELVQLRDQSYTDRPCDGTLRDIINMPDAARESEITYVD